MSVYANILCATVVLLFLKLTLFLKQNLVSFALQMMTDDLYDGQKIRTL